MKWRINCHCESRCRKSTCIYISHIYYETSTQSYAIMGQSARGILMSKINNQLPFVYWFAGQAFAGDQGSTIVLHDHIIGQQANNNSMK